MGIMGTNNDFAVLEDGTLLDGVHDPEVCTPPCVLHSPSDHHMRGMRLLWRQDRKMFERICEHGIGHPDPDQMAFWESIGRAEVEGVHGCCGICCHPPVGHDEDPTD
ncbi:hypothetical protein SEA_SKOG_50 [Gordonia phage Skog]|uniref:Uncharacterized protein n=1 Tax=Gordonia phage Skog TaxID=2704033 RepID=A0A6G6XJC5_9CAUD|nr:hypothetical protein KHQ85_gp050 [Gordonia phage Skog]QIG58202.1 hypothetical protein SEA_SKOG_50 [Gordonia phage Skog]